MIDPIAHQRRVIAEEISRLLNHLNTLSDRPEEPVLLFRIVDASTREYLASGLVDDITARTLTADLAAMVHDYAAAPLPTDAERPVSQPLENPELSPEDAAQVLLKALQEIGPDTDRALMATLRLPDHTYVGDVWLSAQDVEELTVAATALGESHAAFNAQLPPTPPTEMTAEEIADGIKQLEQFLDEDGDA
nr:hypothetical protein OH837_48830 [Streptomyces canus]